jgi:hypothetical protein
MQMAEVCVPKTGVRRDYIGPILIQERMRIDFEAKEIAGSADLPSKSLVRGDVSSRAVFDARQFRLRNRRPLAE